MPEFDFPDLLRVVINCSEYSSSCTEKRSEISLGTLSLRLRIGLPFVKTKTFLWVIYIPWVFSSSAAPRQFPSIFLSAALQGTHARVLRQLVSLWPRYWGGCWGKDLLMTQAPKSREGWIRVERQKAEPVLWKTSPCSGNLSFPGTWLKSMVVDGTRWQRSWNGFDNRADRCWRSSPFRGRTVLWQMTLVAPGCQ